MPAPVRDRVEVNSGSSASPVGEISEEGCAGWFDVQRGRLILGSNGDRAADVLDFWFGEVSPDERFTINPALDRIIEERFGKLRHTVLASEADGWQDTPELLLAAIILLDQFSRNIHRGSSEAFAGDPLARTLTKHALSRGWEDHYTSEQLRFLYLPLAHAEDPELQTLSVAKYEVLGQPEALLAAHDHAEEIRLYGRFPARNEALARPSTRAEALYLQDASPPRSRSAVSAKRTKSPTLRCS